MRSANIVGEYRENSEELFRLCEAWVLSALTDEQFQEQAASVQQKASQFARPPPNEPELSKELHSQFQHALRCMLAVEQAIEDMHDAGDYTLVEGKPPSSVRGFYFARHVGEKSILQMHRCIR